MPIPKSEAPDPEEFVREQLAKHVGHSMDDLDDNTVISGLVLAKVVEALDEILKPKTSINTRSINPDARYTFSQCVLATTMRINGQCKDELPKE